MASFLKNQLQNANAKGGNLASKLKDRVQVAKTKAEETLAQAGVPGVGPLNYDKYLAKPVLLTGKVWKRRGGMGKFASRTSHTASSWELRRFELRGTTLLYYEDSEEGDEIVFDQQQSGSMGSSTRTTLTSSVVWSAPSSSSNPTNTTTPNSTQPRGHLDLKEEHAYCHASTGHTSGAPSPFSLSITTPNPVNPTLQETKWKLAFDTQQDLMLWLAALTNVVLGLSVDEYNLQLLQAANPNNQANKNDPAAFLLRKPPVYEPPRANLDTSDRDLSSHSDDKQQPPAAASPQKQHHQLWFTGDYIVESNDCKLEPPTTKSDTAVQQLEQQHQKEVQQLRATFEIEKIESQQKMDVLTKAAQSVSESTAIAATSNGDEQPQQQEEILSLQEQVQALQEQMSSLQSAHRQQMEELQQEHTATLREEQKKADALIQQSIVKMTSSMSSTEELQTSLQDKDEAIAQLRAELQETKTNLQQEVSQLQETVSTTEQGRILALQLVEQQWQQRLEKEKRQAQDRLDKAVEETKAELLQQVQEKEQAQAKEDEDLEDAETAQAQAAAAEAKVQQALAEAQAAQAEVERAQASLQEREQQIAKLAEQLQALQASTEEQRQALEQELLLADQRHEEALQLAEEEWQGKIQSLQQELKQQKEEAAAAVAAAAAAAVPPVGGDHSEGDEFEECETFDDALN